MDNNVAEQVAEIYDDTDYKITDFFKYRLYESQSITIDWNRFLEEAV